MSDVDPEEFESFFAKFFDQFSKDSMLERDRADRYDLEVNLERLRNLREQRLKEEEDKRQRQMQVDAKTQAMTQMLMPKGIKRDRSDMRIESHYTGKDHLNKGYKTTFYYKHVDEVGKENVESDFHGDVKEF